jgi:hypothetical protein
MKYVFLSPLTIDECVERLVKIADEHPPLRLSLGSLSPIFAKVDGHEFSLWVASRQTWFVFQGTLCSCEDGTRIEGVYRMCLFYKVFWPFLIFGGILFSCGLVVLAIPTIALSVALFVALEQMRQDWWILLASPVLLCLPLLWGLLGGGIFGIGVMSQREGQDIQRILALLEKTLQAQRVELVQSGELVMDRSGSGTSWNIQR